MSASPNGAPVAPSAKRMAAGALLLSDDDRLLIVKPWYWPHWLLPGGVVERHACRNSLPGRWA